MAAKQEAMKDGKFDKELFKNRIIESLSKNALSDDESFRILDEKEAKLLTKLGAAQRTDPSLSDLENGMIFLNNNNIVDIKDKILRDLNNDELKLLGSLKDNLLEKIVPLSQENMKDLMSVLLSANKIDVSESLNGGIWEDPRMKTLVNTISESSKQFNKNIDDYSKLCTEFASNERTAKQFEIDIDDYAQKQTFLTGSLLVSSLVATACIAVIATGVVTGAFAAIGILAAVAGICVALDSGRRLFMESDIKSILEEEFKEFNESHQELKEKMEATLDSKEIENSLDAIADEVIKNSKEERKLSHKEKIIEEKMDKIIIGSHRGQMSP